MNVTFFVQEFKIKKTTYWSPKPLVYYNHLTIDRRATTVYYFIQYIHWYWNGSHVGAPHVYSIISQGQPQTVKVENSNTFYFKHG